MREACVLGKGFVTGCDTSDTKIQLPSALRTLDALFDCPIIWTLSNGKRRVNGIKGKHYLFETLDADALITA
jgi:hypothetical protein